MTPINQVLASRVGRPRRLAAPPVVTSPKNSAAYQAHSYPTKIPPEAIVPFIEAFTTPGAVVLDPFCGSGMTGVAAQRCGRGAILSDLSPGAVHLSENHNHPAEPAALLAALEKLDGTWMREVERALYTSTCPTCSGTAIARHTIWSDVHACEACGREVAVWDEADPESGSVPRWLTCRSCAAAIARSGSVPIRSDAVFAVVQCVSGCVYLQEGELHAKDLKRLSKLADASLQYWIPTDTIDPTREMYRRSALHLRNIETVADFYLPRAKHALGRLWQEIGQIRPVSMRNTLRFAFTNTAWHASRMRRYNARGGQRPLTGTLYIPQLTAESNVFEIFRHQVKQLVSFAADFHKEGDSRVAVRRSSAADLAWLEDSSVDYIFTDPPFGSNIFYADCNLIWEAWLGDLTDAEHEMVVNRSRRPQDGGKSIDDYEDLLAAAFAEMRRVLRPQGRASIVFHNSDDKIWTALLRAAERAGLRQTEVSILDKVQRSMKGYRGRGGAELVPFYDLVITFTPGRGAQAHLNGAGEIAVDAVRRHLAAFPNAAAPARERSLEYLYSLAVSEVVRQGAKPEGLSYRAFEVLWRNNFAKS
jgi:DNA modification methylase